MLYITDHILYTIYHMPSILVGRWAFSGGGSKDCLQLSTALSFLHNLLLAGA